jgi:NAD(P) transhydrogenase subunit alpha
MKVAVVKETFPGERRVGLVPASVPLLIKSGLEVLVQSGAGEAAGFADQLYVDKGAKIAASRGEAFSADIIVQVRSLGTNLKAGRDDLTRLRSGQVLLGMCDPLGEPKAVDEIAKTGATLFALELIPRTTRAQSMDVLSSMATIIGYRAVLLAATELPKLFPMLMTAGGTLTAAKAFVIGAGVAGLQAIATAKRLGAVVRAYDLRPACREQVESVGGKFVELPLEAGDAQDKGGYAKAQGEEFYRKQRELLTKVVGESDVVITTAAIPGKAAPQLITAEAVAGMHVGSVIVDLAADRGGNCALTKADERVISGGVTILGPTNLASEAPTHASQMFSSNVTALLQHLVKEGKLELNRDDEIIRETIAAQAGQIVHPRTREAFAAIASP